MRPFSSAMMRLGLLLVVPERRAVHLLLERVAVQLLFAQVKESLGVGGSGRSRLWPFASVRDPREAPDSQESGQRRRVAVARHDRMTHGDGTRFAVPSPLDPIHPSGTRRTSAQSGVGGEWRCIGHRPRTARNDRATRALADRRPAPRPCPDVPDRLAGRPERRGRVVLRIEDLDASRVRAEAKTGDPGRPALARARLGRGPRRRRALTLLTFNRSASPCIDAALDRLRRRPSGSIPAPARGPTSSRAASAPHPEDEGPSYPGTCSHRTAADAERLGDRPFAWRFRVPPGLDRLARPLPGSRRDRPVADRAATSSSPGTPSAPRISSPWWSTTRRWASTR